MQIIIELSILMKIVLANFKEISQQSVNSKNSLDIQILRVVKRKF